MVAIFSRRYKDREIMVVTELIILVGMWDPSPSLVTTLRATLRINTWMRLFAASWEPTCLRRQLSLQDLSHAAEPREPLTLACWMQELERLLGRAVGYFVISAASLAGLKCILDFTFVPMAVPTSVTLLATWKMYAHLEPDED